MRGSGRGRVIVSNHGGRQLDRAVPAALALPAVPAALGAADGSAAAGAQGGGRDGRRDGRGEVFVDGGLRTGEDVLTALALGARAVFLGRPVLWALACGGAEGVHDLLTGLTDDLAHVMTLAGAATLADASGLTITGTLPARSRDADGHPVTGVPGGGRRHRTHPGVTRPQSRHTVER